MQKSDSVLKVAGTYPLMTFLIENLKGKNRDNIKSLLKNKQVWINGKAVTQYNHPLVQGDEVTIRWARESDLPSQQYLNIVYEDDYIIVIDKRAGVLSVSDGNDHVTAHGLVSEWVTKKNPHARAYVVHRLDQYTSGLLMFVKTEEIQNIFRNDWKAHVKERTYIAVVEGQVKQKKGTVKSYLSENNAMVMISSQNPSSGKLAITHYTTLKSSSLYSLLEVHLETGKKNQIRVHMQDIGHSVAGDRKYGARTNPTHRLCLHAMVLGFVHPVTGENLRFESKIPGDFLRLF